MRDGINRQFSSLQPQMTKQEGGIAFLMFAIFAVLFCHFQLVTASAHHLDSAFLMETLTSIKHTGVPTTYIGQSFSDGMGILTLNAVTVCQSALAPTAHPINIFDVHAYFFLYPLAVLTWLFSPLAILAVANGLSFVSVIFIVYWVIRKKGVPALGAVAFCLLVMLHPAWSHASLGDFYVDRFFMPLGLLYACLLYDAIFQQGYINRNNLSLVLFIGLLAASTTERGAIMIAFFTIGSLILYRKKITDSGARNILIIFSISLVLYVLLYLKLLYVGHPGSAKLTSLLQAVPYFFEYLRTPVYAAQVQEFVIINVLLFGFFALFEWRLAIIACVTLLPNLLTTIGGAEKNGWGTHYHSMYFPFLIFASAIGFSKLWCSLGCTKYRLLLIGLLLALVPAISSYSPGYGRQHGAVKRLYDFYANGSQSSENSLADQLHQIAVVVPSGAKVTTLEGFMPVLYYGRTIYFYPVGIDVADYAVLTRVNQANGSFYYTGAVSYLPGETQKVDICLNDRLKKAGYNLEKPRFLLGSMAVLERKK